ncbi:MAG TPA: M3 family oligoendopeptidase [Ktedonobacteraceae bacterium]|nr:M3 family oligoendopeptidase [Ktedonobacteraceae bacterium]
MKRKVLDVSMYSPLPQSSEAFEALQWIEIEPWYRELVETKLAPDTLELWLRQWSQLSALVDETNTWLEISTTRNTADETLSQRRKRFLDEIFTHVQNFDQQIKQQLLASSLEPEGFAVPLSKLRADAELFRPENVPLLNDEKQLGEEYMGINGAQMVLWEGKEIPIVSLFPQIQDPDRQRREQAWRTFHERKLEDRETLNELWIKGLQMRQQIAHNAGYDNYRAYRWQQLYRFDYTPDDCKALHDAVEQVIVPVASQLAEKRRKLLGVETLRPWDTDVDPRSNEAPRAIEDIDALLRQCADMFNQIDPVLGGYFDTMIKEQCFDLEERANKAPGGYNLMLEVKQLPFIFGHVMIIQDIVWLVFHEAGHAFHAFEARGLPYHQRKESMLPMEFAEVASTSMEFIGSMNMLSSGLCSKEEARNICLQHLEETLMSLPIIIRGDVFQHWVYENPEQALDPEAVGRKWAELGRRFQPHLDWNELEAANRNSWQYTLHFFEVPFYYIEYAFAMIGALQVWRNYLRDPQGTIQQYRQALALGATRPLPELYTAAGAKFTFDATVLQDIVQLVTDNIEKLEQEV